MKKINNAKRLVLNLLVMAFLLTTIVPVFAEETKNNTSAIEQKQTVTGTVTDNNGDAIPGVNVMEKGTTNGVITDVNGQYTISVTNGNSVLAFSFIGYVTKEVSVKKQRTINVSLTEEVLNLEEVVVVGYGVQKKRDLTGAVTQVKATSLEKERPATVQDILRANVAGLNIGLDNSAKGGGSMEIRGKRSIKASNEPLLVVDGIIYYGSLDEINPNDIAQIDVLKDASSAAVYGAKSAAGVVLITTKKGAAEKPTVQFNASVGVATLAKKMDVYNPQEYLAWRENVQESIFEDHKPGEFSNPNNLPAGVSLEDWISYRPTTGNYEYDWLVRLGLFEPEIDNYFAGRTFDWYDETYQKAFRQDYNVNISGKKDKVSYYWSLGYLNN